MSRQRPNPHDFTIHADHTATPAGSPVHSNQNNQFALRPIPDNGHGLQPPAVPDNREIGDLLLVCAVKWIRSVHVARSKFLRAACSSRTQPTDAHLCPASHRRRTHNSRGAAGAAAPSFRAAC
ncbi:hypothetical protein S40288_11565 [Stachybotrys chartarum IBT 40288]|nr:hypothetical protein S40288_11565 [Stachybotrys chartarum IBT 40288]